MTCLHPDKGAVQITREAISREEAELREGFESVTAEEWITRSYERSGLWLFRRYWRVTETVKLPCPITYTREEKRQLVPIWQAPRRCASL